MGACGGAALSMGLRGAPDGHAGFGGVCGTPRCPQGWEKGVGSARCPDPPPQVFVLLFIFVKRQIMRFAMKSRRGPHVPVGQHAPKVGPRAPRGELAVPGGSAPKSDLSGAAASLWRRETEIIASQGTWRVSSLWSHRAL